MNDVTVKLGEGGRVVIPAEFRKELGMEIGDELVLHIENETIVLLSRMQAIHYVQEQMAKYNITGRALSAEIISDRRKEADNE